MENFDDFRLGENAQAVETGTSAEARGAAIAMAGQARRTIDILSRQLDPPIYDDAEFVEAVKQLAIGTSRAQIRIAVQDVSGLVSQGHRLVALAQRLSSFIQIKVPDPVQFKELNEAFLVVDETGLIYRELSERYDAVVCFNSPGRARDLTRLMDKIWETGRLDPNLRSMRI